MMPKFEQWWKDQESGAPSMVFDSEEAMASAAYEQGKRDATEWISVNDRLPEERTEPYQVVVVCTKKMGGMYKDRGIRSFLQDWAVRRWPQNFTHWMEAMPLPQPPTAAQKEKP